MTVYNPGENCHMIFKKRLRKVKMETEWVINPCLKSLRCLISIERQEGSTILRREGYYLGKHTASSSLIYFLATPGIGEPSTLPLLTSRAQVKYPLIFIEGQMDWPMPGAHRLLLEEPSGTCSYAIVKRANESSENKTTN